MTREPDKPWDDLSGLIHKRPHNVRWRLYRATLWLVAAIPLAGALAILGWIVQQPFHRPVPMPPPPVEVGRRELPHVSWQFEPEGAVEPLPEPAATSAKLEIPTGDWRAVYPATPSPFVFLQAGHEQFVLDLRTFEKIAEFKSQPDPNAHFLDRESHLDPTCLSPDGKHVARLHRQSLSVLATATGKEVQRVPWDRSDAFPGWMPFTFVTPTRLVASSQNKIRVYEVGNHIPVANVSMRFGPSKNHGQCCAVSGRGRFVAVYEPSGEKTAEIVIYDLEKSRTAGVLPVPVDDQTFVSCLGVAFSADGLRLACALFRTFFDDKRELHTEGKLFVWELKQGKLIATVPCLTPWLGGGRVGEGLQWLAGDKGWLVAGSLLVDAELEGVLWREKDRPNFWRDSFLSFNVPRVHGSWHRVLVESKAVRSGPLPREEIEQARGDLADRKAQQQKAVVLRSPEVAPPWKPLVEPPLNAAKNLQPVPLREPASGILRVLFSQGPSPKAVILDTDYRFPGTKPGTPLSVWASTYDLESGNRLTRTTLYDSQPIRWEIPHLTADLDPSGRILAIVDPAVRRRLDIWTTDGKKVQSWIPYIDERVPDIFTQGPVAQLFAVSDQRVLTLSSDGEAVLWDVASRLPIYRAAKVHGIALSPRRDFVAASQDHGIDVFRTATGGFHGRLALPASAQGSATLLGFTGDGAHLLAFVNPKDDEFVHCVAWNLVNGQITADFRVAPDSPEHQLLWGRLYWSNKDFALDQEGHLFDFKAKTVVWSYEFPLRWSGGATMNGVFPDDRCWLIRDGELQPSVQPHPAALELSQKVRALAGKELSFRHQPVRVGVKFHGLREKLARHEDEVRERLKTALILKRIRVAEESKYAVMLEGSLAGKSAVGSVAILDSKGIKIWEHKLTADAGKGKAPFEWLVEKTLDVSWPWRVVENADVAIVLPGRSTLAP